MKLSSPSMEWKLFQKKIAPLLLWILILSTIFLLFSLFSSNPFMSNNTVIQGPTPKLSVHNATRPPPPPSPPPLPSLILPSPISSSAPSSVTFHQSIAVVPLSPPPVQPLPPPLQPSPPPLHPLPRPPSPPAAIPAVIEECDLSEGNWVREARGPSYTNESCRTLPELKNCAKYGKEMGFVNWRWKPERCELPRFDPRIFLTILSGKKLAFIGDSLARNHMESLLCLLSQAETPKNIYKDYGDKFRTWHFPSHNFTLMVMWTEFLVTATERIINGKGSDAFEVHLDRVNRAWADQIPSLDYIVISCSNWFFRKNYMYEKGELIGCVNCYEGNLTDFGIPFAVRRVFRTALQFISSCRECNKGLVTFARTYSPSHFEHGHWFTGGYCNRSQPLEERERDIFGGIHRELRKIQREEVERVRGKGKNRFRILDVTKAMMLRVDGHPGSHWPAQRNVNDCLHWCLPGPIDMWNDLLLETLRKS